MSQLSKSLEKRIQELTASIGAQKTELAAYQRVLHLEASKGTAPSETTPVVEEAPSAASTSHAPSPEPETEPAAPSLEVSSIPFKGNKTSLVVDIVKTYGSSGATPKEVDAFFTSKSIHRSKNLVYNTLSYLVASNKLVRREGKYFTPSSSPAAARKKRGSKAAAKTAVKKAAVTPRKRKISPEGRKRISEALKKRWADRRAAAAGATKKAAKKKA